MKFLSYSYSINFVELTIVLVRHKLLWSYYGCVLRSRWPRGHCRYIDTWSFWSWFTVASVHRPSDFHYPESLRCYFQHYLHQTCVIGCSVLLRQLILGITTFFKGCFARSFLVPINRESWHCCTVHSKKMCFGKNEGKVKIKNLISKKKFSLKLLHHRLGYRPTRSLLAVYNKNVLLRVDPDPFWTSCQISTINKNPGSKTLMKPNTPFKWVFIYTIPSIYSKNLRKDTTFPK